MAHIHDIGRVSIHKNMTKQQLIDTLKNSGLPNCYYASEICLGCGSYFVDQEYCTDNAQITNCCKFCFDSNNPPYKEISDQQSLFYLNKNQDEYKCNTLGQALDIAMIDEPDAILQPLLKINENPKVKRMWNIIVYDHDMNVTRVIGQIDERLK